jgi:hypothetical protein
MQQHLLEHEQTSTAAAILNARQENTVLNKNKTASIASSNWMQK